MRTTKPEIITVVCVEDNPQVAGALRVKLERDPRFCWLAWLPDADEIVQKARESRPSIILLDLDMPGKDPFTATQELVRDCPESRVVIVSGHVRIDLIRRALEAGAWGYVSKNDHENELLNAVSRVADGEMAFSPEVGTVYNSQS